MKVSWNLPEVSESKVVKIAIAYLFDRLVREEGEAAIVELPVPSEGAGIIQSSFMRRLLSQEFQLKSATRGDVCAAQPDLRLLSLLQLLAIRSRSIDFATVSSSHSAHSSFLETVDALVLEKLARRGLSTSADVMRLSADALRSLGLSMMLVIGAAEVLATEAREGREAAASVPRWWGFRLGGEMWAATPAALFQREALSVHLLGSGSGFDVVGDGELVAVAPERGSARTAAPSWKVVALDPRQEDVLAELMASCGDDEKGRRLHAELAKAVLEHASTRIGELELDDEAEEPSDEPRSFLVTPPAGKVSAAIQAFQGQAPAGQGLGASKRRSVRAWLKSGLRWRKSGADAPQMPVVPEAACRQITKDSATSAGSSPPQAVSRQRTQDSACSGGSSPPQAVSRQQTEESASPGLQARQLSGDSSASTTDSPEPEAKAPPKERFSEKEHLARLLAMFDREDEGHEEKERSGTCSFQYCLGPRDRPTAWSTFFGSFTVCVSR